MNPDFIQFASERGLIIDRVVHGRWERTKTVDHAHKKNGAYFLGDGYAIIQNWATMQSCDVWKDGKPRTPYEQEQLTKRIEDSRKAHAAERENNQRKAAQKANFILSQCELSTHAYLHAKGWKDMLGNVWSKDEDSDPVLVVPMYFSGKICGAQCIGIDSQKKFVYGQRTNFAYHRIGQVGQVYLVEGYATALSLFEVTQKMRHPCTIYATFSAGNLVKVASNFSSAIIIADHDESGVGQKAAESTGLKWWMPEKTGQDFNDYHQEVGTLTAQLNMMKVLRKLKNAV
jgi:putative DNA primase/helicase